ncbi:MAG: DMT family transporter [Bacillota bacterium]
MTSRNPYLLIFIAILCVSTASIMVRFTTAPPLVIAFYRLSLTALLGGCLMAGTKQSWPARWSDMPRAGLAGFFLALHFAFWISSLSYTSVASSVLFTNLQVIFVIIFSRLILKERVNRSAMLGVAVALAGSAVIGGGDLFSGRLWGDLLALISGFLFAVYLMIGRSIRDKIEIWPYTVMISGIAGIILAIAVTVSNLSFGGYPALDYVWFLLMALLPGIGGHGILNWALKYVKAPVVAISILGESVGASILGYFLLHESLAWFQLLGGAMILFGIYWAVRHEATSRR